jgi:hypothetical protein
MRPLVAVFAAAGLFACEESVELTRQPVVEDTFADAYADAWCQFGACCAEGGLQANPTCRDELSAATRVNMEAARGAGATFDGAAAEACVAAMITDASTCPTRKSLDVSSLDACRDVYAPGSKSAGETCVSAWECSHLAGPTQCTTSESGGIVQSRCASTVFLGAGEACVSTVAEGRYCQTPLVCFPDSICRHRLAPGEACDLSPAYGDLCIDGYVCDRLASEICVPAKAVGESCTEIEECELFDCEAGQCGWSGRHLFAGACILPP